MAVLIKGMNGLPPHCGDCDFSKSVVEPIRKGAMACRLYSWCAILHTCVGEGDGKRDPRCPLVLCEDDRVPCVDETLDKVMEEMCEYCRYPFEYKDPDEMFEKQCNHCKVAEKLQEVLYGRKD